MAQTQLEKRDESLERSLLVVIQQLRIPPLFCHAERSEASAVVLSISGTVTPRDAGIYGISRDA